MIKSILNGYYCKYDEVKKKWVPLYKAKCVCGNTEKVLVTVPASHSHTGKARKKKVPVDKCIAPFLKAVLGSGIITAGCCCGHGERPGNVSTESAMRLVVTKKIADKAPCHICGSTGASLFPDMGMFCSVCCLKIDKLYFILLKYKPLFIILHLLFRFPFTNLQKVAWKRLEKSYQEVK